MGGLLLETGLAYYANMHPGAVGLVEQDVDFTQVHVVRNWCYLGSAANIEEAKHLSTVAAGFDADGYKILVRPMLGRAVPVVVL
jgi:excinuclease Cho